MIPEIVSVLAAATASSKNIVDLLAGAREKLKGNKEAEMSLGSIQGAVLDLQSSLLVLQTSILKIQAENQELREKLAEHEREEQALGKYEAKQKGSQMVAVLKGQDGPPYFCYNCYENHVITQLSTVGHSFRHMIGTHQCEKCKTKYRL